MFQNIDLGLGGVIVTPNRLKVIHFLYPYMIDTMSYGTSIPDNDIEFDILVKPFGTLVWLCLMITFALFILLNYLKDAIKYLELNNDHRKYHNGNLAWIGLCILLRQRYPLLGSLNISTKICIVIWLLATIVLIDVYASYLCSFLAIPNDQALDNLEKLVAACENDEIITLMQRNTTLFETVPVCVSFSDKFLV